MTEQPPREAPIEIDFVADLACPWCYLGLVRLDRARAMRPDRPVRVRWRPFFLNPGMPQDGMDRAAYLRRKFGGDARDVYRRIEDSGRADGVTFAFERMPRTPNTLLAHRLILFAEEQGKADAVIRALFRALFQDGRDVGRPRCSRRSPGRPGSIRQKSANSSKMTGWRPRFMPPMSKRSGSASAACRCSSSIASMRSPARSRPRCWPA